MPPYPPVSTFANGVTIGPVGGVAGQLVISGSNLVMQGAPGFTAPSTFLTSGAGINTNSVSSSFQIDVSAPGNGLKVAEGTNAKQGLSAAMTAGAVTVSNTSVTANSRIFVTRAPGGTNPGAVYVSAITAATSFVITSTNAADTGQVFFEIFEPG